MEYRWTVTYQYHTADEDWTVKTQNVMAESIGEALDKVDSELNERFENNHWSDYHITSICIAPELH